ncbi:MAG TPA: lytic polysaccharide monooxygenase [Pilimelia sp.]|nr:lytic polysaccharide monooxygenase [Pilimelia sp.]
MIALRTFTAVSVACLLALTVPAPAPASAHGSVTDPVSRVVACGPNGGQRAESAACIAARAVNGASFDEWDNLRVPDVRGRDREVIPDGKLCSAGLEAYQGLDLARKDWPATTLRAGADVTFTYEQTIPHEGTFRLYVTKPGYSSSRKLRWADLGGEPFLSVTDPPRKGDAYLLKGKLPNDRAGRHLIYTVWQNSDTRDTYYACSDVVFAGKAGDPGTAGPRSAGASSPAGRSGAIGGTAEPIPVATSRPGNLPLAAAGAGLVLAAIALVGGALVLRRRGRQRLGGAHRA